MEWLAAAAATAESAGPALRLSLRADDDTRPLADRAPIDTEDAKEKGPRTSAAPPSGADSSSSRAYRSKSAASTTASAPGCAAARPMAAASVSRERTGSPAAAASGTHRKEARRSMASALRKDDRPDGTSSCAPPRAMDAKTACGPKRGPAAELVSDRRGAPAEGGDGTKRASAAPTNVIVSATASASAHAAMLAATASTTAVLPARLTTLPSPPPGVRIATWARSASARPTWCAPPSLEPRSVYERELGVEEGAALSSSGKSEHSK